MIAPKDAQLNRFLVQEPMVENRQSASMIVMAVLMPGHPIALIDYAEPLGAEVAVQSLKGHAGGQGWRTCPGQEALDAKCRSW